MATEKEEDCVRKIKFRAWIKESEKMVQVAAIALQKNSFGTKKYAIGVGPHLYDMDNNCYRLEDCILIQYTGLKNKNGIEIYEGDVIKTDNILWLVEPIPSLESDEQYWGICVSPWGNGKCYLIEQCHLDGEVIGDIYRNPELLQEV